MKNDAKVEDTIEMDDSKASQSQKVRYDDVARHFIRLSRKYLVTLLSEGTWKAKRGDKKKLPYIEHLGKVLEKLNLPNDDSYKFFLSAMCYPKYTLTFCSGMSDTKP